MITVGLYMTEQVLRHERHSVTTLQVHLVCVTKYRTKVLTEKGLQTIREAFESVASKMNFRIIEFNGEADHVHVLIEYPPKLSVSALVNHLKGVSSRLYGKAEHPKPHATALWSPSYFATSVGGASIEVLQQYVQRQKKPS
jgi:putative transposase